jgi:CheY-like chemotaxis protein
MKILYIEDNRINRLVVQKGMAPFAEVTTEENGFKGIELAKSGDFEVILIDLNLSDPQIDGFGVLEALRQAGSKSLMIALTAFVGAEWEEKCLQAGFDLYLSKPIRPKDLWAAILNLKES